MSENWTITSSKCLEISDTWRKGIQTKVSLGWCCEPVSSWHQQKCWYDCCSSAWTRLFQEHPRVQSFNWKNGFRISRKDAIQGLKIAILLWNKLWIKRFCRFSKTSNNFFQHLEVVIKSRIPGLQSLITKTISELETELSRLGKPVAADAGVSNLHFSLSGSLILILTLLSAGKTVYDHGDLPCFWSNVQRTPWRHVSDLIILLDCYYFSFMALWSLLY